MISQSTFFLCATLFPDGLAPPAPSFLSPVLVLFPTVHFFALTQGFITLLVVSRNLVDGSFVSRIAYLETQMRRSLSTNVECHYDSTRCSPRSGLLSRCEAPDRTGVHIGMQALKS